MSAQSIWLIGSTVPMLIGVVHLFSTILTQLLHPRSKHLVGKMKTTKVEVDDKISIWNAWMIFNIGFSIFLCLVGFVNFFLGYYHFEVVKGLSIYSIAILIGSAIMIYFAHKYTVQKIRTVFLVMFILYFISSALSY